jgi:hypothetical protein
LVIPEKAGGLGGGLKMMAAPILRDDDVEMDEM